MRTSVSLDEIRSAVRRGQRMAFLYGRERVVADFYMLAHAKKTGAFVVVAWCHEPVKAWRHFRYARIFDLEPIGPIDQYRPDFDPCDAQIRTIDCLGYAPQRRHS
ncbi:MAG: WYL domain-containing protein [Verrucomicrobiaceae bacterium]|nr:MAG: WYL domain-containing protein [Verrucomicrobiaceae bacterium]